MCSLARLNQAQIGVSSENGAKDSPGFNNRSFDWHYYFHFSIGCFSFSFISNYQVATHVFQQHPKTKLSVYQCNSKSLNSIDAIDNSSHNLFNSRNNYLMTDRTHAPRTSLLKRLPKCNFSPNRCIFGPHFPAEEEVPMANNISQKTFWNFP